MTLAALKLPSAAQPDTVPSVWSLAMDLDGVFEDGEAELMRDLDRAPR